MSALGAWEGFYPGCGWLGEEFLTAWYSISFPTKRCSLDNPDQFEFLQLRKNTQNASN